MFNERKLIYNKIAEERDSDVLFYATGDRRFMEVQIASDVINIFSDHLETIRKKKITLVLYTNGGLTLAAWNLVNMIREYCSTFEVIVLIKALSAGSMICLGADKVIMSNQSTLGPIDPSLTTPLNPVVPGTNPPIQIPISVEDVKGYIEFAKNELRIRSGENFKDVYSKLSDKIHPVVIGKVYRSKEQIKMLAKKLLLMHNTKLSVVKRRKIINFLCSDSGSHDYTINKTEAISLGLPIENASKKLKRLLYELYQDFNVECLLDQPFDPAKMVASTPTKYSFHRGLIESIDGGSHAFVSEGVISVQATPMGNQIADNRIFEGWRKIK